MIYLISLNFNNTHKFIIKHKFIVLSGLLTVLSLSIFAILQRDSLPSGSLYAAIVGGIISVVDLAYFLSVITDSKKILHKKPQKRRAPELPDSIKGATPITTMASSSSSSFSKPLSQDSHSSLSATSSVTAPDASSLPATATTTSADSSTQPGVESSPSAAIFSKSADQSPSIVSPLKTPDPPPSSFMSYTEFCRSKLTDSLSAHSAWAYDGPLEYPFCKLHFSIDRKDISRFYLKIMPLLKKYNLSFKIIKETYLENTSRNLRGKELVIYFSKQQMEKFQPFLNEALELVKNFEAEGIGHSERSLADLPIEGGRGYIYFRADRTSFGNMYIPAENFEDYDFTLRESACLCDHPQFPQFGTKSLLLSKSVSLKDKWTATSASITEQIKLCWSHGNSWYGSFEGTIMSWVKENVELRIFIKNPNPMYNTTCDNFLKTYLDHAAKIVEKACLAIDSTYNWRAHLFARNLPAIYYHFFIPLHAQFRGSLGTLSIEHPFKGFPELEKKLIAEIVRCSFRERGVQQDSVDPVYIEILKGKEAILERIINDIAIE